MGARRCSSTEGRLRAQWLFASSVALLACVPFMGKWQQRGILSLTTFLGLHKEQSLWCDALMLIDFCDILKIYHMSRETLFALYLIGTKQ
jgi:hypothetical protein